MECIDEITFPSYSFRDKTSGAMYAGVPTVDLGLEWSNDDWKFSRKGKDWFDIKYKIFNTIMGTRSSITLE